MGLRSLSLILVAGAAALPLAARADDGDKPKAKGEASATVTITAETIPVELAKTPNPVKVITEAQIEQSGAKTLGELLTQFFPGQIMSNGGPGSAASFYLGASRPQDVVVLLDGLRLTDASGLGAVNPNSLSLAGLQRVEVLTGPASTLYGADAQGGVIALYTGGTPKEGFSASTLLATGTRGHRAGALSGAYAWAGGWVRVGAEALREDAPTDTENPFRSATSFISLGQQLGEETLVTASYRNAYEGIPVPLKSANLDLPRTDADYDAGRESSLRNEQLTARLSTTFGATFRGELSLGQALQTRREPAYLGGQDGYDSRRNQAGALLRWEPSAQWGASLALDAYEEFAATPGYPSGTDRAAGRHLGATLEIQSVPVPALRLVYGLRAQRDRQSFTYTGATPLPEGTSGETTFRLGANLDVAPTFRLYASGGTGFTVPFLQAELYHAKQALPGAYERLQNERSKFLQLGAGWHDGPWTARLEASRTTFETLVSFDLATYDYVNSHDLRIQGLESTLSYQATDWEVEGFVRSQEARDLSAPGPQQLTAAGVLRRPFFIYGLSGRWKRGPFEASGRFSQSGHHYEYYGYDSTFSPVYGANRTHFSDLALLGTWTFRPGLSLGLRGEHLLQPRITRADWLARTYDQRNDASQIYGFPAPGPTWSLELRYRL
ncbi:MAG TPA: TonB-dependent receptor plug domain-containing protein [Holophagaceae bacterium]|nr:TonB-dependent receptor plug domain-containing protein [Holophagaceae bacterium]